MLVLNAILPIFGLLVLGNIALRSGFLPESFWLQAEKATYYVLFPALLIENLATAKVSYSSAGWVLVFALFIPLLASALCFLIAPWLKLNGPDFTSFFQGGIRFNTFIGLALVGVTLPNQAIPLAAVLIAVMIPTINLLCIGVFARYTHGKTSFKNVFMAIAKNPLILACLIGIALNQLAIPLPTVLLNVLQKLGQMSLSIGLLAVGAGLRLSALRTSSATLVWVSLLKLIVLPALIYIISSALSLDANLKAVLVVFAALPTASSAYILARQLGGNAPMMAVLITGETLLSMATLPLVLMAVVH